MNTIEILKDIVYNHGLNTLLQRMEVLVDNYTLKELCSPVIISTEIVDMNAVIAKIKETWTNFNIKDVKINTKKQAIEFKIYGSCWIPSKYRGYIVFRDAWSNVETELCDCYTTIKEEDAEINFLPITEFIGYGIESKTI